MCVSRPAGADSPDEPSLHEWLVGTHPSVMTAAGTTRVCHNLDYATSGVVACAKSEGAAREVGRLFEARKARKLYAALVFGHPTWEERNISARIAVTARKFRQSVTKASWGKAARTTATVAARGRLVLPPHRGKEASLLWLTPHGGATSCGCTWRTSATPSSATSRTAPTGAPTACSCTRQRSSFPRPGCSGKGVQGRTAAPIGGGSGCADDAWVRGVAPLAPRGWHNAFTPSEPLRSPAFWPGAVGELLGSGSQGALKGIRAADR